MNVIHAIKWNIEAKSILGKRNRQKNARQSRAEKHSISGRIDHVKKKYPPDWHGSARIGRLGAAFSTARAMRGGRSCRFAAAWWMGSGSIFHAETSQNISKFLVIIFACNLHRVV
ncbi:hypothetical protein [Burkholderia stagnalis]|uniref:hypothetical protein n=1 Tax=Burkholderia stagnalis TaxID=1503054 RepID=UPI0018C4AA86|nr:hypothetical protein [Burkholderia stagnalis]